MPVSAAHPDAVKLDEAFREAMDTPGKPREPGPPPETDKAAPFGRDDDGAPLAPFGLKKDGTPKLSAAGRKPSEDRPRVAGPPARQSGQAPAGKPPAAEVAPRSYAPGIADTLEVLWLGGTVIAQTAPKLPLAGRLLPSPVKIEAQAALILAYKQNLAGALDICARHNESARKLAEKLSGGGAGWALNAAFMLLPFVGASMKVWGKPELDPKTGKPPVDDETGQPLPTLAEQLAEQNRAAFDDYMAKIAEQAEAAHGAQPAADA